MSVIIHIRTHPHTSIQMQFHQGTVHSAALAFGIQYLIFDRDRWNENSVNRYLADAELHPLRLTVGGRFIRAKFTDVRFDALVKHDYKNGVIGLIGIKKPDD